MKARSVVIFLISVLVFGGTYFVASEIKDLQARSTVEIEGSDIGKNNEIEDIEDNLFFLLVGVDKNTDAYGDAQDQHVRTDTMMLVNVNFKTGKINTVSIPRDSKVNYKGSDIKINAAHAYDGIEGAIKAVRELTGLDVDHYMSVDYDAVSRIVEAVGGVEVDSPVELNVPEIDLYIPKGETKLNGPQALYFVRARELLPGGTDLERVENQQYFLKQLMKAVLKPSNIMNIGKILDVYKDNVTTNIDLGNLGAMALKAIKFNPDKLNSYTLEGTTGDEYPNGVRVAYFYPSEKKMNILFSEIFPEFFIDPDEVNKYSDENENNNNNYNDDYNNDNDYNNDYNDDYNNDNNYNDYNNDYNDDEEDYNSNY